MKTLKDYAHDHGVKYRAAWNRFKTGKIPAAFQDEFGKILIPENQIKYPHVVCYARVSSSENKKNLEAQAKRLTDYCAAKGYIVKEIVKECASGLNDKRPKLERILKNQSVTRIVVEHRDRLSRFGFHYLEILAEHKQCEIEVINQAGNGRDDLMQDFVSIITSFTARLYGLRRSKRKTEKIIKELQHDS
jgi:putative resolvase